MVWPGARGLARAGFDADRAHQPARAARIEQAKRERLNTILTQLSDGVIAVDEHECIQTLNPTMAQWLGITPGAWLGKRLTDVCPELSLQTTLRLGVQELEKIERVKGKALIVNRMPIVEQGVLTGAVLSGQDPISIQRVDRHIRTRIKPNALGTRYGTTQGIAHPNRRFGRCYFASFYYIEMMIESRHLKHFCLRKLKRFSTRCE